MSDQYSSQQKTFIPLRLVYMIEHQISNVLMSILKVEFLVGMYKLLHTAGQNLKAYENKEYTF